LHRQPQEADDAQARKFETDALKRAQSIRNGLIIALLALCPIRLKNFAGLEIGRTIRMVKDRWWIVLPRQTTKIYEQDERPVPSFLNPFMDFYVNEARLVLAALGDGNSEALWLSMISGSAMTKKPIGTLVSKITFQTLGVDVSRHLFRTAAATSAAAYSPSLPHLASALLGHSDTDVTEEHYIKVQSINASSIFAEIVQIYRAADS